MRIVFMGTPDFAAASLQALLDAGHEIAAVVTRADKPANRGHKMQKPPVKILAEEHNIPVLQPSSMKTPEIEAELKSYDPEILVVVAYGRILPKNILELAPYGSVNVHASILPLYRGPAPVQSALLHGDAETGVTIMKMDEGLDTGDMLYVKTTPLAPDETLGTLWGRLAVLGGEALVEALGLMEAGKITPMPQDHEKATHSEKINSQMGALDFTLPARELFNRYRALTPAPGVFFKREEKTVKVTEMTLGTGSGEPGRVLKAKGTLEVACGEGSLIFTRVKPEGKKEVETAAYLNGARYSVGESLL